MPSNGQASERPAVTVAMPFAGDHVAAQRALQALASIERRQGDELLIADNSPEPIVREIAARWPQVRVLPATGPRSSYYARNVAAQSAANTWLLFLDSDCVPEPGILAAFFEPSIAEDVGAVAGEILADGSQEHLLARYQRDRGYLNQARYVNDPRRPHAVTANLLVRSEAWRSVGGFLEGIRSGGDTEFCWRLQDAGWRLDYRPDARVVHRHRENLPSFARITLRYAAGRAWLTRRYPGAYAHLGRGRSELRALVAAVRWLLAGQRERASFRVVDAVVILLGRAGRLFPNASAHSVETTDARVTLAVFVDSFPEISETFVGAEVGAVSRAGCLARVEASRRAKRQDLQIARALRVDYREDDSLALKVAATIWLLTRHPAGAFGDLIRRGRWKAEEPVSPLRVIAPTALRVVRGGERHLHAHFAGGAALDAMRVSLLTGLPYSVTAHAYDIFREPRNLRQKLECAAFVTTGCDYNVQHLRGLVPRASVHEIVMGIDPSMFERQTPYPGTRRLVAVGRLVEKKGFTYLLDAVAMLDGAEPIHCLEIVGDGPLRAPLHAKAERLGLSSKVRFLGALDHEAVCKAMEGADLLVMPCVVAADGDRDSMPVVVKEALALEIPVVASDEVGLPELVKREWGRLVPPGQARALAEAIAELLALPPQERIRMGRAGRAHVLEHCNVMREGQKLAELISTAGKV